MKKLPKEITLVWLRQRNACGDARKLFKTVFPEGMPLTIENIKLFGRRAKGNGKSWIVWFLDHVDDMPHGVFCEECGGSIRKGFAELRRRGAPQS